MTGCNASASDNLAKLKHALEQVMLARAGTARLLAEIERRHEEAHCTLRDIRLRAQRTTPLASRRANTSASMPHRPVVDVLTALGELRRHATELDDHLARQMSLLASIGANVRESKAS